MLISEKLKALGHLDVRRARDYAEAEFAKADGRHGMSTHIALARACSTLFQELSAAGNAAEAAEFSRMGLRYIDAVKSAFEDLQKVDPQSASPFQAAKILQERAALLEADGRLAEAVSDAKACIAILIDEGADEFADMIEPLSNLIARCLDAAPEDKAGVVGRVERQQRSSATVVCDGDVCRIVSH